MLENVKIYISEDSDSEKYELYMSQKEWRGDVLVEYEKEFYKIEVSTALVIAQQHELDKSIDRVSLVWIPTIIVDDCKKETIIKNILMLEPTDFKYFKPVKLDGDLFSTRCQDINNWKQVYPT